MIDALLLTLDGALVATNAVHARSWATVLDQRGTHVPARRLQREIGRRPRHVLRNTLGTAQQRRYGPDSSTRQAEIFRHLLDSEGATFREGARALLDAVRDRGVKVGVVSGLSRPTVSALEDAVGASVDDLADVFVCRETGDDSEEAVDEAGEEDAGAEKAGAEGAGWLPEDVLRRAAAALDVHPARCAAVVDTPHALYDRQDGYGAVVATGMTGCAVTSEAFDEEVLTQAGARGAYATPNALAADLDAALRRLGPQSVALSQARMEDWMDEALAAAREGMEDGEIPIGSVVVDRDGAVLGRGCNRVRATGRHTHHAEMAAFDDAAGTGLADREGVVLVTTLEPCVMCFGAALQGRVDAIVYAHEAPENGAAGRVGPNRAPGSVLPRMVFGVGRSRSRALLREWNDTTGSGFTRRLFGDE